MSIFPGEVLPVDYAAWHGGPRPRRDGGGPWWGGPGWPEPAAQVVYANPCPTGTWYSHDAERCLRATDPFSGHVGAVSENRSGSALGRMILGGAAATALGIATRAALPALGWSLLLAGVVFTVGGGTAWLAEQSG